MAKAATQIVNFGDATKEEVRRKVKAVKRRINKFKTTKKEILNELRQRGEIKQRNSDTECINFSIMGRPSRLPMHQNDVLRF